MSNPNITATDRDGESLTDAQVEINGLVPGDGNGSGTNVVVEDDGSQILSALKTLDFVAGVNVTDQGNNKAQIDVQVDTSQVTDAAITTAKINASAVTAAKIAADAVGASEIDLSISPTWTSDHTFDATILLDDQAADPSSNGEIQRNGTDVKVYSGGAIRNMSNIGSGGTDTRTDVSDGGTQVVGDTEDINFGSVLDVTDDGDDSASVDAQAGDDEWLSFGAGSDYRIRYDSTADEWVLQHQSSGNEMRFDSNGQLDVPSLTTEQGDITNETRVELERTSTQSISSATWEKIKFDSEVHDDRNEWDGGNYQFSPDKTGTYDVKFMVRFDGGADGDARILRFRDITNSEDVAFMQQDTNQYENFLIAFEKELGSAATYEFQARNGDSSDSLSGNTARTQASIRSSFREQ